jgi:hypothetical protein
MENRRSPKLPFWIFYAAIVFYIALPGPARSFFSGIPLSTRAQLLLLVVIAVGVFAVLFPPVTRLRWRWAALAVVAVGVKLSLMSGVVETGWKGTYYWVSQWRSGQSELLRQDFYQSGQMRPYRVDRSLIFNGATFGLTFVNELPSGRIEASGPERDVTYPLVVRWNGYVHAPAQVLSLQITTAGRATIELDGQRIFRGVDVVGAPATLQLEGRGHTISIEYVKPVDTPPMFALGGFDVTPTPAPVSPAALARSQTLKQAVDIVGFALLLLAAAAFAVAWPLGRLARQLTSEPAKAAAVAVATVILLSGFSHSIGLRHATINLSDGNDPLTYESFARYILKYGPLLVNRDGVGTPYYYYPLYSYALAGAHAIFGEDFGTIVLFNYLCLAAQIPLFWLLLRRRVGDAHGAAMIVLLGVVHLLWYRPYITTAFTDNLFAVLVLAAVICGIRALETRRYGLIFLTGAASALAAATRPSFLTFIPLFALLIIGATPIAPPRKRLLMAVLFVAGFLAAVAPFTLRNWMVSNQFVLLVTSHSGVAPFMFAPGEPVDLPTIEGPPGPIHTIRTLWTIFARDPIHFGWIAVRKVLFTLGIRPAGPPDPSGVSIPNYFFVFTLIFAAALYFRRGSWAMRAVVSTFALSHVGAMVVGAPWTYGYKTILPLHSLFVLFLPLLMTRGHIRSRLSAIPSEPPPPPGGAVSVIACCTPNASRVEDFLANSDVMEIAVLVSERNAGLLAPGDARLRVIENPNLVEGFRQAVSESTGDLVLVSIGGDATDLGRLRPYIDDHDLVCGTRTADPEYASGAEMRLIDRMAATGAAKVIQWTTGSRRLSDFAPPSMLLRRSAALEASREIERFRSLPLPTQILLPLARRFTVIQVPVRFVADAFVSRHPIMDAARTAVRAVLTMLRRAEDRYSGAQSSAASASQT